MTSEYDAFVSSDGKADYLLPSAAFSAGKMRIFVQPGTYKESKDIVIPSGASMTGANRTTTIIDFGSSNASVVISSSYGNIQSTGTVSIANGSTTLYGTSTSFTNLPITDAYIFLNNHAFVVASVVSDTELTLAHAYHGSPVINIPYKALKLVSGCRMREFTVRNSGTFGLYLSGARQATIYNVGVESCATANVLLDNCTECTFQATDANYGNTDGFRVLASSYCDFCWGNAMSNEGYGFYCDMESACVSIRGMHAYANATNYHIFGSNNCLTQSTGDYASVNGIDLDGFTSKVIGCAFNNSGVDNVHVLSTALSMMLACVNLNTAGSSEFNNESSTTAYVCTFP